MKPSKAEAYDALLRTRLAAFTRKTFHTVSPGARYLHNYHIDLIAEYLEACTNKEIKRLIINIPPRMMKSISVSIAWPAWLLGRDPMEKIVASSYAAKLALKHSMDCRLVIQSPWYQHAFPNTVLAGDQNEKSKFATTALGHRIATSVGASVIGEGGNYLIVDDPLNPSEAASETQRTTANEWFDQGFVTRLDDKHDGVMVVVMQRLHQNDLSGHLLEKGGWEHLCVPAIAERKTILDFGRVKKTREAGEPLHAEREGGAQLEAMKVAMGSYAFAGQYQQRPAPAEGGLFKIDWFQRYAVQLNSYSEIVQSWDTAHKAGELNDPSVCTTWGIKENGYDLLHVLVKRMEYPELKRKVAEMAAYWQATTVIIEDKASGQSLLQDLRGETILPLIAFQPEGDKVMRASNVTSMIEGGRVFLPEAASWLSDFETELMTFPNAAHDDQVDSVSQFLTWVRNRGRIVMPSVRRL